MPERDPMTEKEERDRLILKWLGWTALATVILVAASPTFYDWFTLGTRAAMQLALTTVVVAGVWTGLAKLWSKIRAS
jgi:hypothetical protein